MASQHRLDFGDLDLVSRDGGGQSYSFYVLAEGFDPGSPEAVKAVVATAWRDGDDSRITRFGNRLVRFRVEVNAPDSYALGLAEAALAAECRKGRNTLTWTPPDGYGATSVYEVLNAHPTPIPDDLGELRCQRTFALELECRPWVRSADLSVVTASLSGGSTVKQIIPIAVDGSVRTEGSVKLATTGGLLEYAIVFTDPAMAEYGYDPQSSATWANAPTGRYMVWLKNPGSSGDVLTATVGSQVARTRLGSGMNNWAPIGSLDLGARRDGTLGSFSLSIARNGSTVTSPTLLLFRWDEDTALTFMDSSGANYAEWIVDSPSLEQPMGGVWGDGVSVLSRVDSWGHPLFAPPETALFVYAHANTGASISITAEFYRRWMHNAGD